MSEQCSVNNILTLQTDILQLWKALKKYKLVIDIRHLTVSDPQTLCDDIRGLGGMRIFKQ